MPDLPLLPMSDADVSPAWYRLAEAFGGPLHPEDLEVDRALVDPDRFLVSRDGDRVVATGGSFALRMTLPGAVVPVAGVSWVSVLATHRRRGVLRELMTRLLRDRYEAGETVAALWASEGAIYQRFGYGPATWQLVVEARRGAAFTSPVAPGGLRLVEPTVEHLAPAYDRVAPQRPGFAARDDAWWAYRLYDPDHRRAGAGPLRCVVTDDGAGYALYATTGDYGPTGPAGKVQVREVVAATPDAQARLWRFLLDLDLTATVHARLAVDDPLLHLLAEPRAAQGRLSDALWVRPVEVAGALGARRYAADVDVVLDVRDDTCPWNARRWRLSAGPGGATCAPTPDPSDLALDVSDLGAALLGGTSLLSRAAAGRVEEHRSGALQTATAAFGPVGRSPFSPLVF